jgi:RNA polymerase sigma-70 factor (ECF subfamily)
MLIFFQIKTTSYPTFFLTITIILKRTADNSSTLAFKLRFTLKNMSYSTAHTDQQLLDGCRQGDSLAQRYLYERYGGRLLAITMRYTSSREEAVEMLNTAFFKIFTSVKNYEPTASLYTWMSKIVFHTAIDYIRANTSYRKSVIYEDSFPDHSIDNDALNDLAVEDLYELVQQLPPATKAVFSLYAVDGYKHKEIAEMLHISEGTSKWHLAEARRKLQASLNGEALNEVNPSQGGTCKLSVN